MKKMVLHTENYGKQFCKYTLTENGMVVVDYYLPKSNISVIWEKNDVVRICGVRDTVDGKKSIARYQVHPAYWYGAGFSDKKFRTVPASSTVPMALTDIFNKYIKIL